MWPSSMTCPRKAAVIDGSVSPKNSGGKSIHVYRYVPVHVYWVVKFISKKQFFFFFFFFFFYIFFFFFLEIDFNDPIMYGQISGESKQNFSCVALMECDFHHRRIHISAMSSSASSSEAAAAAASVAPAAVSDDSFINVQVWIPRNRKMLTAELLAMLPPLDSNNRQLH